MRRAPIFLASILLSSAACGDSPDELRARSVLCAELKVRATVQHDDGEKSGSLDVFRGAQGSYAEYLATCEAEEDAYEMLYYAGELQWAIAHNLYRDGEHDEARDHFRRAHEIFTRVVAQQPDGKWAEDATEGARLAKLNAEAEPED